MTSPLVSRILSSPNGCCCPVTPTIIIPDISEIIVEDFVKLITGGGTNNEVSAGESARYVKQMKQLAEMLGVELANLSLESVSVEHGDDVVDVVYNNDNNEETDSVEVEDVGRYMGDFEETASDNNRINVVRQTS